MDRRQFLHPTRDKQTSSLHAKCQVFYYYFFNLWPSTFIVKFKTSTESFICWRKWRKTREDVLGKKTLQLCLKGRYVFITWVAGRHLLPRVWHACTGIEARESSLSREIHVQQHSGAEQVMSTDGSQAPTKHEGTGTPS